MKFKELKPHKIVESTEIQRVKKKYRFKKGDRVAVYGSGDQYPSNEIFVYATVTDDTHNEEDSRSSWEAYVRFDSPVSGNMTGADFIEQLEPTDKPAPKSSESVDDKRKEFKDTIWDMRSHCEPILRAIIDKDKGLLDDETFLKIYDYMKNENRI